MENLRQEFIRELNDEGSYPDDQAYLYDERNWSPRRKNHSCSDGGGVYCTDACDYCEEHNVEQCDECA